MVERVPCILCKVRASQVFLEDARDRLDLCFGCARILSSASAELRAGTPDWAAAALIQAHLTHERGQP